MKPIGLVRSWTAPIPPNRRGAVINDRIPRIHITDCNFLPVIQQVADDTSRVGYIHLDWDIAPTLEQLRLFVHLVTEYEGRRIVCSPYHLYRGPEPSLLSTGFGMIYLPQAPMRKFLKEVRNLAHIGDSDVAEWWHTWHGPYVAGPLVAHLNYDPMTVDGIR